VHGPECVVDYLVAPAKFISNQRPPLFKLLQSIDADDFGQFRKQVRQTAHLQQAQQKNQSFPGDHPQQPAHVVACGTQHRMQCIAFLSFEVAAVHTVISFEVPDARFVRLSSFEQPAALYL
jgi:hypothetical protein